MTVAKGRKDYRKPPGEKLDFLSWFVTTSVTTCGTKRNSNCWNYFRKLGHASTIDCVTLVHSLCAVITVQCIQYDHFYRDTVFPVLAFDFAICLPWTEQWSVPSVVSLFFSLEETLALRALVACLSYYNKNSRRRRRISYERFF